ncbi:MAG: tRNA epoxyqueuosine(34) reductase QueG [Prevotella sp.]|nr:tRNA epoxyqueuosine(34) reductase QueG [Prevotella sp.]
MNSRLSNDIKAEAKRLGFFACGIAKADRVSDEEEIRLRTWLQQGMNADMDWMNNYLDKRLDPRLLMDGLQSIVSVAMSYVPAKRPPKEEPQLAAYALGQDYHDVVKQRLRELALFVYGPENIDQARFRVFVDSGPVLERYWAEQAGLGWIGKNRQLIIPHAGSMFFLGELFLDIPLDYDTPMPSRCGRCTRCIDHCPTHALSLEGPFDSHRCISYQTIENRHELSEEAKKAMGNVIYGCDICQQVCPWNRFATPNHIPEFQPKEELLNMTRERWKHLSIEDYRRLFKGSAVKRVKYEGLMRNISNLFRKFTP